MLNATTPGEAARLIREAEGLLSLTVDKLALAACLLNSPEHSSEKAMLFALSSIAGVILGPLQHQRRALELADLTARPVATLELLASGTFDASLYERPAHELACDCLPCTRAKAAAR